MVLITALWIAGLLLVQRAVRHLPWSGSGTADGASPHTPGHRRSKPQHPHKSRPTWLVATIFLVAAAAALGAGVVLERAGDAIAEDIGLSGVLFGATFLALATALPEISTDVILATSTVSVEVAEALRSAVVGPLQVLRDIEQARTECNPGYGYVFSVMADSVRRGTAPEVVAAQLHDVVQKVHAAAGTHA